MKIEEQSQPITLTESSEKLTVGRTKRFVVFMYQNPENPYQGFSFNIEDGNAFFLSQGMEFDESAQKFCDSVLKIMQQNKEAFENAR